MLKIIYFKNNTCNVCHALLPKIKTIVADYQIELEIADITQKPQLCGEYMVFSVPAVLIFDDKRKEINRFVRNFSEFEIRNFLERCLELQKYDLNEPNEKA